MDGSEEGRGVRSGACAVSSVIEKTFGVVRERRRWIVSIVEW